MKYDSFRPKSVTTVLAVSHMDTWKPPTAEPSKLTLKNVADSDLVGMGSKNGK